MLESALQKPLFQAIFYPLGFPLALITNSLQVVDIATDEWGAWKPLFDAPPVELNVQVSSGGPPILPAITFTPGREEVRWEGDANHYATGDPALGSAQIWLSATAAGDAEWLRYYFLDAVATHMITSLHLTRLMVEETRL